MATSLPWTNDARPPLSMDIRGLHGLGAGPPGDQLGKSAPRPSPGRSCGERDRYRLHRNVEGTIGVLLLSDLRRIRGAARVLARHLPILSFGGPAGSYGGDRFPRT